MYKIAVSLDIYHRLMSLLPQSKLISVTVDVDIAIHACLYASRAAAPEPCGPRGTALKRSSASRARAAAPTHPRPSADAVAAIATHEEQWKSIIEKHANISRGGRHLADQQIRVARELVGRDLEV